VRNPYILPVCRDVVPHIHLDHDRVFSPLLDAIKESCVASRLFSGYEHTNWLTRYVLDLFFASSSYGPNVFINGAGATLWNMNIVLLCYLTYGVTGDLKLVSMAAISATRF
jgi:hypothetical protein